MWKFILIGDMVAMGFMIVLTTWMLMRQSKESQDYCMNIPLLDVIIAKTWIKNHIKHGKNCRTNTQPKPP
jgi:fatty-acid desaturase